jgi:hypothetical protein
LAAGHTWFVLIVPTEYTAQVFSKSSKIFSRASVILKWPLFWIEWECA